MPDFLRLHQQLVERFPQAIVAAESEVIDPWIVVNVSDWLQVAKHLRNQMSFDYLNCITAIDYFEPDDKKAKKLDWEPHIDLVYHLSSLSQRYQLVIKLKLDRWQNDEHNILPQVPSVANVWRTADWHEREVYDLMGVEFTDHPDLRRILCPEDWKGHPLRKDYEMPLEYHGIRGK